jgi:C_GCAxxG_C_C family probable redox protein
MGSVYEGDMISKGDLRFNCCESVLIRIDRESPLPGFDNDVMRIASAFGGGVAGWGSVCGAVSGVAMALGLIYGTDGDEHPDEFQGKRDRLRDKTQRFLRVFEEEFGSVNCMNLLGVDRRIASPAISTFMRRLTLKPSAGKRTRPKCCYPDGPYYDLVDAIDH